MLNDLAQPGKLDALDVRERLSSRVMPLRRRGLRIEINDEDIDAMLPEGGRKVQRDGRFSNSPFLIDQSQCPHGVTPTCVHVNMSGLPTR
jgi:hypothetical protein